jgi:hypothetical protein
MDPEHPVPYAGDSRLRQIKASVDPGDVIRSSHHVRPAG